MEKTGRCLCGAVSFAYEGAENWRVHCHCESCRRQTASAFTTFLGVSNGQWAWTGATPKVYRSSPGVRRSFCGTCGTPLFSDLSGNPALYGVKVGTLDDPSAVTPAVHAWTVSAPAWSLPDDGLPRFERNPQG